MDPSKLIDAQIAELNDWRGARLQKFRELVHTTAPELNEEFKWGVGVFTYKGKLVCAMSAFKGHTKFNFFKGAQIVDRNKLFNSGLESKQHRSINLSESDAVNEPAIKELIIAALNLAK